MKYDWSQNKLYFLYVNVIANLICFLVSFMSQAFVKLILSENNFILHMWIVLRECFLCVNNKWAKNCSIFNRPRPEDVYKKSRIA